MSYREFCTRNFWTLKRISLIIGFIFAMVGTVGQNVFVDHTVKAAQAIEGRIRRSTEDINRLQSSYFAYFFAAQQASILFVIDPGNSAARQEALGDIYKGNLLDRAVPFRFILATLAVAGIIDYAKIYQAYLELNDKARAEFNFTSYQAVNDFEHVIIERANDYANELAMQRFELAKEKASIDQQIDERRSLLLVIAGVGSIIMLVSNVVTAK